jgi:hypothetical protein
MSPELQRLAHYRGVPGVRDAGDLRMCIFRQFTKRELEEWRCRAGICVVVTCAVFLAIYMWCYTSNAPGNFAFFLALLPTGLACGLTAPDPLRMALREFRRELQDDLQQRDEAQRIEREQRGL